MPIAFFIIVYQVYRNSNDVKTICRAKDEIEQTFLGCNRNNFIAVIKDLNCIYLFYTFVWTYSQNHICRLNVH